MSNTPQEAFLSEISNTPDGILIGTDPKPQTPVTVTEVDPPKQGRWSDEDLEKVRRQEKEKLYPQIEELKNKLSIFEKERNERLSAEEQAQRDAEEQARKKAESEMDLRTLWEKKEQELQAQIELERQEREKAFQELEYERRFAQLQQYTQRRLDEEKESLIPELADLVSGTTPEEVEASINSLKERSARILGNAQAAMQSARRDMAGARVTAPSTGPLDAHQDNDRFTGENIANMTFEQYVANRSKLLGQSTSNRGMFA